MTANVTISFPMTPTEATNAPYWLVIDPKAMLEPDPHAVACMITGPFFSREEAETYLKNRRYAYSDLACVYCHSGWRSSRYVKAWRDAEEAAGGLPHE